jgi:hypothetical protein
VAISGGDRRDITRQNLFRPVGHIVSAVAQLAKLVVAHGPQTAAALEKQANRLLKNSKWMIFAHANR